jgi:hypothetical protein
VSESKNVNVKTERNSQSRGPDKRKEPFFSVLLVAWVGVPALCLLFRLLVALDQAMQWWIFWPVMALFGTLGPATAILIGVMVAKRVPFVTGHVAVTIHLFGVAVATSVLIGWNRTQPHTAWPDALERFWFGLLDAVSVPLPAFTLYLICSLALAGSWLLYRIDAFRAATGSENEDTSNLAKLVGWPKGAKVRSETIEGDEFAVTATIDHEGIPVSEIRAKLPAIEENPGVIRGRSSIVGDAKGGRSTIRLVHTDPHSQWRIWPGLSHPGGSYTDPIRTSYYSTGETQWYSFVKTPQGYTSEKVPGFNNTNDSFHGTQGATGTGKSGDSAIENAEVLSRRNVQLIYVDTAKLLQNAGWCLDFVSLAAGSKPASGTLFRGLRRLGEYRTRVLGEAGFRNFTDEAAEATGLSWLHIFADEFDVANHSKDIEWLATKGRSLGFRLSITLPRATAKDMSADIRGAIGMWSQFGITQDYDKGFVLQEETILAGANPEAFGVGTPGVHYLDGSPAVDRSKYAIDCRTYQTREDFGDLRRAVEAARATFTPAAFTPGELEVLGDIVEICAPSAVRQGKVGQLDDEPADGPIYTPAPRAAMTTEGRDMESTLDLDDDLDDLLDDDIADLSAPDASEEQEEFGPINPREEIAPPVMQDGIELKSTKPRSPNAAASVADFDAALIRMAERGVRRFTNSELRDELMFDMSPPWISQRMKGLCDEGKHVSPPGITIARVPGGRGEYTLIYLSEHANE